MYSDKKNILQLAALLKAHGVRRAVLCPGSRNAPILHTLVQMGTLTCWQVTDERSAGFQAIGLSLENREPVAVCCTSGSALLNLHPAVAEAFYQQIPLIVISADRPPAWIGQMDGQTLPQPGIFGGLVRKSVSLPEIRTEEDEWYCNRLINEALLELDHHGKGPVHINVPLSEPLYRLAVRELPPVRVIRRCTTLDEGDPVAQTLFEQLNGLNRRMVVAGESHETFRGNTKGLKFLVSHFVWLAEHLANQSVPPSAIRNFDLALSVMDEEERLKAVPDLLITCGGHIVSKRLKQFLRAHPPKAHWHISPDGQVVDLFGALTLVVEMDPQLFWERISERLGWPIPSFPLVWENFCSRLPLPRASFSQFSMLGKLLTSLPPSAVLHLANSSTVRYAQLYPLKSGIRVCCNRGVNGIEGSLSAAIGFAATSSRLNVVCIGDLSFFYDMNALWCGHITSNLRIILFNNGGGEIFETLQGVEQMTGSRRFILADHRTTARGWAESRGFRYFGATNLLAFHSALPAFLDTSRRDGPVLLEVFTDRNRDISLLKSYCKSLKNRE